MAPLQGISFDVAAGEKIGIVGRTGSGKSSLIVTLFRLVEPLEGAITLDGQNILELGLEDVRSRIAGGHLTHCTLVSGRAGMRWVSRIVHGSIAAVLLPEARAASWYRAGLRRAGQPRAGLAIAVR